MSMFRVIICSFVALMLACLPFTMSAAENPLLADTKAAARTEIWKAITSGKAGSASIAIMEKGKLVYSEGFGMADREKSIPVDKNTVLNIGSISKVYCATAVMLLVDDGKIDLDKPVTAYLPEFAMADERYRDITVRMLLNHSSGLPGTVGPNSFGYEYHKEFYDDVLAILAKSHLKHRPGEMAPYTNDGFTVAEMVVAKVSGKSYLQFVRERILDPLSLHKTGPSVGQRQGDKDELIAKNYTPSGSSEPLEVLTLWGSGGLSANPEDVCVFADSFSGAGPQILSSAALAEMRRLQPSEFYHQLRTPDLSYGLGWDVTELASYKAQGLQVLGKSGGTDQYASMLYTIPDKRISVAVIATGSESGAVQIANTVLAVYLTERGLIAPTTEEVRLPVKGQPIPAGFVAYEGYYDSGEKLMKIAFNLHDNVVTFHQVTAGQEVPLLTLAYNDNYFHFQGSKYYFTTVGGRDYFVRHMPLFSADAIRGEKLAVVANPIEIGTAVDNRVWLRRNAKAYEGKLFFEAYVVTSRLIKDLPGYVEFLGTKKVETPSSLGYAIHSMRDLTEVTIKQHDGTTWAWVSGLLFTSADSAAELAKDDRIVVIGSEGYNEWLRIPADTILTFRAPEKGRVMIFSSGGEPLYDNVIDHARKMFAPAGSFVAVAGNPGDIFELTAQ